PRSARFRIRFGFHFKRRGVWSYRTLLVRPLESRGRLDPRVLPGRGRQPVRGRAVVGHGRLASSVPGAVGGGVVRVGRRFGPSHLRPPSAPAGPEGGGHRGRYGAQYAAAGIETVH